MHGKTLNLDDNEPFRKALRSLIEQREGWVVCSEAANGREAVEKHGQHTPCLTVMDFNMPFLDGLAASRLIVTNCAGAKILMVTLFTSAALLNEAKRAGIKGFCAKTNPECITAAIDALLQGGTYFHSAIQASA
jgi:DNA-binding NarL/FixJ family response regulator